MKKNLTLMSMLFFGFSFSQVGINNTNPQSTLDIKSKGNTAATKALSVTNSGNTEILTLSDIGNLGVSVSSPQKKMDIDAGNDAIRIRNLASTSALNSDGTVRILVYDTSNGNINYRLGKQVQSVTLNNNESATITDTTGGINGTLLIRSAVNSVAPGANMTATFNYARRGLGLLGVASDITPAPTSTRADAGDGVGVLYTVTGSLISFSITKPTPNTITVTNLSGAQRGFTISTEAL